MKALHNTKPVSASWGINSNLPLRDVNFVRWLIAVSVICLISVAGDLFSRNLMVGMENPARWPSQDWLVYSLSTIWVIISWFFLPVLAKHWLFNKSALNLYQILLAIWLSFAWIGTLTFRQYLDNSPSWQAIRFLVNEPHYTWELSSQFVSSMLLVFALLVLLLWVVIVRQVVIWAPGLASWSRVRISVGSISYLIYSGVLFMVPGMQSPTPVEAIVFNSFAQYGLATASGERHLVTPVRKTLAKPNAVTNPPPNILILLQESLSADAVFKGVGYTPRFDPAEISPWTSQLADKRQDGYFVLNQTRSNSTATESSLPNLLSGIDLGGESDAYGTAQSVWSLGRAAGAHTFLFSSAGYEWSHFDEFFLDINVDLARSGRELGGEIVNELGVDDELAVNAAITHIRDLAETGQQFVGVVNFSTTHLPGYAPDMPESHARPDSPERYSLAVKYLDSLNQRLVDTLMATAAGRNTIILFIADHGEQVLPKRPPQRMSNYYDTTIRVPAWVYIGPDILQHKPEWGIALDSWQQVNAQNLDILPTVRDMLGFSASDLVLPGRSWVKQAPVDDIISGQSTTSFRQWHLEGLFAVRGKTKVIVNSSQDHPEIYNLASDPDEKHNLWSDAAWQDRVRSWMTALVNSGQDRLALCQRLGSRCPYANGSE